MRPTTDGSVGLDFGAKPWNVNYAAGYHTGRDYRASTGTSIRATRGGIVVFAGWYGGWGSSYGNHVIVATGSVRHSYNHLSRIYVRRGQIVSAGKTLGLAGSTGNVTGAHLHYEERTSPWTYWDHRRPQFDSTPPEIWDVGDLAYSARREPGTARSYNPKQVKSLSAALRAWRPDLISRSAVHGHFSRQKVYAFKKWQTHLGHKVIDGIPGPASLKALATEYGKGAYVRD